jgi:hypothetical protein
MLTDSACKKATAKEKPYKLSDFGGLYLEVMPSGSKYWRYKYRYNTKEKRLALGTYPFVSLVQAREARDDARRLLKNNIDPADAKRAAKRQAVRNSENTFKLLALEWYETKKDGWSKKYAFIINRRLERDIFPFIGRDTVRKIKAPDIVETLRKIEKRDALDLAGRVRGTISEIFKFGIQIGRCENNPASNLTGAIKTRKVKHLAAITSKEIPELLTALENNDARLFSRTRRAVKLSMLTFVRPGELRQMEISDVDL